MKAGILITALGCVVLMNAGAQTLHGFKEVFATRSGDDGYILVAQFEDRDGKVMKATGLVTIELQDYTGRKIYETSREIKASSFAPSRLGPVVNLGKFYLSSAEYDPTIKDIKDIKTPWAGKGVFSFQLHTDKTKKGFVDSHSTEVWIGKYGKNR